MQGGMPHNPHGQKQMKPKLTELERFLESNQDLVMESAHKMQQKISYQQEKCIELKNEDKFVQCMTNQEKVVSGIQKKFEFRLHFWKLQTEQCFKDNPNDKEQCKKDSRANIRKYLDSFVRQL